MTFGGGGGEPGPGAAPVQVHTVFEQHPSALKGAFVLRGADGNPHSVRLTSATISRLPQGSGKPVPVEERLLDVGPTRDLFVPFDAGISDLDPGWYRIESSAEVDGGRSWTYRSRGFRVPWPRTEILRGSAYVGRTLGVGEAVFHVDRVEMNADSAAVVWKPDREGDGGVGPEAEGLLFADGLPLEVLPAGIASRGEARAQSERRTLSYPVPRSARRLAVAMRLSSGEESERIEVALPSRR